MSQTNLKYEKNPKQTIQGNLVMKLYPIELKLLSSQREKHKFTYIIELTKLRPIWQQDLEHRINLL